MKAMNVEKRMSHPVITIKPDVPIHDALKLMRKESIRRLPVINEQGQMVGIVSEMDILHAEPSDATSLSVWELNYLLSRISVRDVMTHDVVSVSADTPIEEAARIMADTKIGGLPVLQDGDVVGIITETDLFKVFLELLGAREAGVRFTALVRDVPGELAKLTSAISAIKGNIVAMVQFLGESPENRLMTVKVAGVTQKELKEALKDIVVKLVDVRTMTVA
jgi:acetoin utilization protein AcuB